MCCTGVVLSPVLVNLKSICILRDYKQVKCEMNTIQKLKNMFNQKTVIPESAMGEFRNYCQAALQTAYVAKLRGEKHK